MENRYMEDDFKLTLREREVLGLMARGYMNKQIAGDCGITEQATKNYVSRILKKLDTVNRTGAVVKASQHGLVQLDD
jgi:DNA-binding NarL/FixJ family response regulator